MIKVRARRQASDGGEAVAAGKRKGRGREVGESVGYRRGKVRSQRSRRRGAPPATISGQNTFPRDTFNGSNLSIHRVALGCSHVRVKAASTLNRQW